MKNGLLTDAGGGDIQQPAGDATGLQLQLDCCVDDGHQIKGPRFPLLLVRSLHFLFGAGAVSSIGKAYEESL